VTRRTLRCDICCAGLCKALARVLVTLAVDLRYSTAIKRRIYKHCWSSNAGAREPTTSHTAASTVLSQPRARVLELSSPVSHTCGSPVGYTLCRYDCCTACKAPQRLRRRRFTAPCMYLCYRANSKNASLQQRRILPCCAASCRMGYAVPVSSLAG
jgi:hypothetical protein